MCFISLYLIGKLHVFGDRGRGRSWRLLISITPLFLAMLVAVSRTADYHHHYQDVIAGSILGICLAYLCYRQYYPPLNSKISHRSYADINARELTDFPSKMAKSASQPEAKSFLDDEKDSKWI